MVEVFYKGQRVVLYVCFFGNCQYFIVLVYMLLGYCYCVNWILESICCLVVWIGLNVEIYVEVVMWWCKYFEQVYCSCMGVLKLVCIFGLECFDVVCECVFEINSYIY